jgi:hypothetical protein
MRIVAVEEHFTWQDLLSRIDCATLIRNGWPAPGTTMFQAIKPPALADTGEDRMAAMKTAGICMQVLSVPGPGAEIVSGPDGVAIAREFNAQYEKRLYYFLIVATASFQEFHARPPFAAKVIALTSPAPPLPSTVDLCCTKTRRFPWVIWWRR